MRDTLRYKALEAIKNKIFFFETMPGEKLSDKKLASEFCMGRTPVREALLVLERERLVQCHGKQGYFVRKLTRKEVDEYLAVRAGLEVFAVPLIVQNVTHRILEELRDNIEKAKRCVTNGDFRGMIACNSEFHSTIYKTTRSDVFIEVISSLNDKFYWLRAPLGLAASEASPGIVLRDHNRIVDAIEEKHAKRLKRAIESHLDHTREKYAAVAKLFSSA